MITSEKTHIEYTCLLACNHKYAGFVIIKKYIENIKSEEGLHPQNRVGYISYRLMLPTKKVVNMPIISGKSSEAVSEKGSHSDIKNQYIHQIRFK